MTRFTLVAALAVVLGLGFAGTADAQYIYRNTAITPNGGLVTTHQVYSPFGGYQTQNVYVSPYGAVRRQYITGDVFGNTYGRANGFNPNTGVFYNRGFYNPSPVLYPYYGGYNYNFYRR
jgi:hypothetical protein